MTGPEWPAGADRRLVAECNCDYCRALVEWHLRGQPPQSEPAPDGTEPLTAFADAGNDARYAPNCR